MNSVKWKDIDGYAGKYMISNKGEVLSLARISDGGHKLKEKLLSIHIGRGGYLQCALTKNKNIKTKTVHRLVAQAFVPNPLNLPFACHKDDNPLNPEHTNIFWGTHQDNMRDMVNKGRNAKGEKAGAATLLNSDVIEIKEHLALRKLSHSKIAKMYGVTKGVISSIKTGRYWSSVRSPNFNEYVTIDKKGTNRGSTHGMAKLKESDIVTIKRLLDEGITGVKVARMFSVSVATVSMIKNRKVWKHV